MPTELSQLKDQLPPKILLFGAPGTRKSTFATTAGDITEILDIDRNLQPLLKVRDGFEAQRLKLSVTECYDVPNPQGNPTPTAFQKARARLQDIVRACAKKEYDKKILVIDSLTTLGYGAIRWILNNGGRLYRSVDPTVEKPPITQPEYGLAIHEILQVLTYIRTLPIAVILTGHEYVEEFETPQKTGAPTIDKRIKLLALGKKLPKEIPIWFPQMWHTECVMGGGGNYAYKLRTKTTALVEAKGSLDDGFDMSKGIREAFKNMGVEL